MAKARRRPKAQRRSFFRSTVSVSFVLLPPLLAASALAALLELEAIENTLDNKFQGERWSFPSKIYSDSYPVFSGMKVDSGAFKGRLIRLGYRSSPDAPSRPGEFRFTREPHRLDLWLNSFEYPSYREKGRLLRMDLDSAGRVMTMFDQSADGEIYSFFLEPGLIAGVHGEAREERREMTLDEIPTALVRAVVAVEDRRFFDHAGVDLRGLGRALLVNISSGSVQQGGSTLTQQLMKNFFLSSERSISRKLREAAMAMVAERRYSKYEILENYLNEIYLGQDGASAIHGVWEAAKFYFGREPADLSVAQMATIAGLIRAPNYYSPHRHPDRAEQRRNVVLDLMHRQGDIDDATYAAALAEKMDAVDPPKPAIEAPYFVDFVRDELLDRYPREVLTSEGYRIFTSLDAELQTIAERVVRDNLEEIEQDIGEAIERAGGQALQAALIAINPRTGAIRAMVGGRDYGESQFNRATESRRQPGSTFKPIVMLAALGSEHVGAVHMLPTTKVLDAKFEWKYEGQVWSPSNYENKFYGEVTVREVIEHSLNSATARIAHSVGIVPIRDLAVRLGMDPQMQAFPAIVLGGWEVPPFELAKVFGVFANGGMAATPISVKKVIDRKGGLVEGHRLEMKRVIPAADAYLVTHLLEGVMERGTGAGARRKGFRHPAAGKTGTSNDYKDAWFAGYTPDLLAVVWVGFDRKAGMGLAGSEAALPIWTDFMRQALADAPHRTFDVPEGVVLVDIDEETGGRAVRDCHKVIRESFLAGEEPRELCPEHALF